jgi:hypothetical protein
MEEYHPPCHQHQGPKAKEGVKYRSCMQMAPTNVVFVHLYELCLSNMVVSMSRCDWRMHLFVCSVECTVYSLNKINTIQQQSERRCLDMDGHKERYKKRIQRTVQQHRIPKRKENNKAHSCFLLA